MTRGAGGGDEIEKRVGVAIIEDFFDAQNIAESLPLLSEPPARATPKPGEVRLSRLPERGAVHVREHEDVLGCGVLYDGRHQPIHFFEIRLHCGAFHGVLIVL